MDNHLDDWDGMEIGEKRTVTRGGEVYELKRVSGTELLVNGVPYVALEDLAEGSGERCGLWHAEQPAPVAVSRTPPDENGETCGLCRAHVEAFLKHLLADEPEELARALAELRPN